MAKDKLSEHFSWEEAIKSDKAVELGFANLPDAKTSGNIYIAASKLEEIRKEVGPILINSWYRSQEVNKAIGGVTQSAHCSGYAIDCRSTVLSPLLLCKKVASMGIEFDQIIHEYGKWMHISFDPRNRGQLMTKFSAGYIMGLLTEEQYNKKV